MGIRKEIPGGNLVTEYYNRIKAKTLAALLAYVPEDVNIPVYCEEDTGTYRYLNGSWVAETIANNATYLLMHPDKLVSSVLPTDMVPISRGGVDYAVSADLINGLKLMSPTGSSDRNIISLTGHTSIDSLKNHNVTGKTKKLDWYTEIIPRIMRKLMKTARSRLWGRSWLKHLLRFLAFC